MEDHLRQLQQAKNLTEIFIQAAYPLLAESILEDRGIVLWHVLSVLKAGEAAEDGDSRKHILWNLYALLATGICAFGGKHIDLLEQAAGELAHVGVQQDALDRLQERQYPELLSMGSVLHHVPDIMAKHSITLIQQWAADANRETFQVLLSLEPGEGLHDLFPKGVYYDGRFLVIGGRAMLMPAGSFLKCVYDEWFQGYQITFWKDRKHTTPANAEMIAIKKEKSPKKTVFTVFERTQDTASCKTTAVASVDEILFEVNEKVSVLVLTRDYGESVLVMDEDSKILSEINWRRTNKNKRFDVHSTFRAGGKEPFLSGPISARWEGSTLKAYRLESARVSSLALVAHKLQDDQLRDKCYYHEGVIASYQPGRLYCRDLGLPDVKRVEDVDISGSIEETDLKTERLRCRIRVDGGWEERELEDMDKRKAREKTQREADEKAQREAEERAAASGFFRRLGSLFTGRKK